MPEMDEMSKPSGLLTMKKTTDPINPEKGHGLDYAIIHSINNGAHVVRIYVLLL